MSGPVDVLAVLADYSAQHGDPEDFEQARAAVAELIEAAKCVDGIADHASFVSDECCCGSRMDVHDIGSGHAPVDSGAYYGGQALDRLRSALARCRGEA